MDVQGQNITGNWDLTNAMFNVESNSLRDGKGNQMAQPFPRELQKNQANLTPPGDYQLSKNTDVCSQQVVAIPTQAVLTLVQSRSNQDKMPSHCAEK